MKRVRIIATGGTIAMRFDPYSKGLIPTLTTKELVDGVPGLDRLAEFEVIQWSNIPSPHITPQKMFELAQYINASLVHNEADGIVVTHGTDTLEETAYLNHLILKSHKPVIFTAAMRTDPDLGIDGPRNILNAVRVAICNEAHNVGVMVVMDDEIHDTREVTKTRTSSLSAFKSPGYGPLGMVDKDRVFFNRRSLIRHYIDVNHINTNVDLIKLTAGCDDRYIRASLDAGVDGLIIEAFGRGNVPPIFVDGIRKALEQNVIVVMVSRCFEGRVLGEYSYEGGGKMLHNLGVILGDDLSGQKARILLMVALAYTKDKEEIQKFFTREI